MANQSADPKRVEPKNNDTSAMTISYQDKTAGRVEVEADLCKGCYLCIEACPPGVLVVSKSMNKMGYSPVEYSGDQCTGCGICFYVCPEPDSIRVYKRKRVSGTESKSEA